MRYWMKPKLICMDSYYLYYHFDKTVERYYIRKDSYQSIYLSKETNDWKYHDFRVYMFQSHLMKKSFLE